MLPYYGLVFIPISIYLLGAIKGKRWNKICISIFFIIFIIMLSFKGLKCGADTLNYSYFFDKMSSMPFEDVVSYSDKGEVLFFVLNKGVSLIGGNFQLFLFIVAILSVLPIAKYYYKKSENALLTIALFLTVAPFSMYFSGLRQCISMGIIIFSIKYVENKKILKYCLCVFIAMLFHNSALYCLILYPIYHANITKKWLYFIIPFIGIVLIFNKPIFRFLLQSFNTVYDGVIQSTGAYSILILLMLFIVYCFILPDKNKTDKEFISLRNILVLSAVIQCFASINTVVMRINYYYLLLIPVLISKVKNRVYEKNIKIVNFIVIIMIMFFIIYFFYNAYMGPNILHIFPYIPFWEGVS